MPEQFDIFNEAGERLGTEARSVVHRAGIWHRASNIFVFLPDGRLLIQRRQLSKDVCPGAWDVSTAEHLKPGETFEEGALRGLEEELGISGVKLETYGEVVQSRLEIPELGIRDFEFQQSFRTTYPGSITPDPEEVLEVRLIELVVLEEEMANEPERFTPWFHQRASDLSLFK